MDIKNSISRTILATSLSIGVFASICIYAVVFTYKLTETDIKQQAYNAKVGLLNKLLVGIDYDNNLLINTLELENIPELGIAQPQTAYIAKFKNNPVAIILPVTTYDGYSGAIKLLAAVDVSGRVINVRVLEHKETPGLGDKIDIVKSDWITNFSNRSLNNTHSSGWQVKKYQGDFDQLTGATITSKAVIIAVHDALQYLKTNQEFLHLIN